jgi:ribosomal protein S10
VCKVGHISKTVDPVATKINRPCVLPVMKILQIEKFKSVHKTDRERRKMATFPKLIRLAPKSTGLEALLKQIFYKEKIQIECSRETDIRI